MGRFDTSFGGRIHLVEDVEDVAKLDFERDKSLAFVTQTTLSMDDTANVIDALKDRFPAINAPRKDDICYATQNRQDAVKLLSRHCEVVLVVGSPNSSNSNRLRELAEHLRYSFKKCLIHCNYGGLMCLLSYQASKKMLLLVCQNH